MRGWRLRSALLAGVVVALGAAATASATVGGPPTYHTIRCLPSERPCSPLTVLWEDRLFNGPAEFVAYTAKDGLLCGGFDYLKDRKYGVSWGGGYASVPDGELGVVNGVGAQRSRTGAISHINGLVVDQAARVRVSYRKWNGTPKHRDATVVRVDGATQARLELNEPVNLFVLTVRGRTRIHQFRATAYDAGGRRLGSILPLG